MNWEYLKQFNYNPPTINLLRQKTVQDNYNNHKININVKNINIEDYIINKYFKDPNSKYYFTLNTFPYNLEDNIKHYIIWLNPIYYNDKQINFNNIKHIDFIKSIINVPYDDFIFFENNIQHRSVLGIRHIHVFIKN